MVETRGTSCRRVAVLGAGPAGITAAYVLSKDPNIEVSVFEADSCVGGMSKTFELWNQRVDMGPQLFFSSDPRVNSLWLEILANDYSKVSRLTRIYSEKKIYDQSVDHFKYSEKLWGIPHKDLDADLVADANKNKIFGEFSYPHSGTGEVYERMARKIVQSGGHLYLSRPVKGLWTDGSHNTLGVELFDGDFVGFDHVISSMPINKLLLSIKESPIEVREAALKLKFRNTILVYLEVEGTGLFPDQWVYVHDSKLQTARITNFRNWAPELNSTVPNTILALEYWCYDHDLNWKQGDAELIDLATKEISETGLVENRKIYQGEVLRVPRCNPVYEAGYKENLNVIEKYLEQMSGVQAIGRTGAFKYNNQDHSILMGLLAAENIIHESNHNLWRLNTDYKTGII